MDVLKAISLQRVDPDIAKKKMAEDESMLTEARLHKLQQVVSAFTC